MTQAEIGEKFGVSDTTIKRWMDDLGIDTRRPRPRDVVREIRRLAEGDTPPTQRDFMRDAVYSRNAAKNRFGSWSDAVRAAGLEPHDWRPGTGEDNPAWSGGFKKYYGPNWSTQRTKAIVRDQARCQDCGMTESESLDWFGYKLDVHHLEPIKSFKNKGSIDYQQANQVDNLVTLCRSCHGDRERSD